MPKHNVSDSELEAKLRKILDIRPHMKTQRMEQILALVHKEREADRKKLFVTESDVAWCLGKLRGLGYPNEALERKYGLTNKEEK